MPPLRMTPPPEKPSSQDPLADLDNDLGDDWESAFEAEEFLFSPEDEPVDSFLLDEDEPDNNSDIAALPGDPKNQKIGKTGQGSSTSSAAADAETAGVLEFPSRLQILAASLLQLFQSRPHYQRLLIVTLPVALILLISTTLFFYASNDKLVTPGEQAMVNEKPHVGALSHGPESSTSTAQHKQLLAVSPKPEPTAAPETISHKWQLPTFVIVVNDEVKGNIIVNIDLVLTANLAKGQLLPDDKQIFARDIIYQFYTNRPADELKRFSLARGEMISQLNAWLNKQWQNNPFDTITFSRYQVIQTAPSITPASLAPKVTFM